MKTRWIAAACLLASALLAGCEESKMPPDAPPPKSMQACAKTEDCILISTSCNGCCQRDAINKKDSAGYEAHRGKTCVGKQGGICDCVELPAVAECREKVCTLVVLPGD
jgi:hypothetical protein